MNNPITTKVSAISKGEGTDTKKPASLEVFADDEKYGFKYSLNKCLAVFVQTLNKMCLDTEMISLYEHFVLCGLLCYPHIGKRLTVITMVNVKQRAPGKKKPLQKS